MDAARKAVQKVQEESFEMDVEVEMNYYHSQYEADGAIQVG